MRLSLVALLLAALGCMCGAPEDPSTPPAPEVEATPASTMPTATVGGWPASIEGVCQMEADCGCLEKPSAAECARSLERSAAVFTPDVLSCVVTQTCAAMCGGGGVRCVKEGAARQSARLRADHEVRMGIIENFPDGNPCARGQTAVTDYSGAVIRCQ